MTKELIVVGGPNGSGKTTFAKAYLKTNPARYLSADDLAERINPDQPERAKLQAGRAFFRELQEAIATGEDLVVESTLSGLSFQQVLQHARREGYHIQILFVFLDSSETCGGRVRERVRKGGHDVPDADIRRRFGRSQRNFWHLYRPLADSWHLYFNGGEDIQVVAAGEGENYQVLDDDLFAIFSPWTRR